MTGYNQQPESERHVAVHGFGRVHVLPILAFNVQAQCDETTLGYW